MFEHCIILDRVIAMTFHNGRQRLSKCWMTPVPLSDSDLPSVTSGMQQGHSKLPDSAASATPLISDMEVYISSQDAIHE